MITLSSVKKSYKSAEGEVTALKGVDLSIERGEIYGIIGLSGAGKSTLIRCINMLERPTEGKVIVDGKDLTTLSEADLRKERKGIGMIFQHFNLLSSATVYDNVAFPLRLANADDETIQKKVEPLLALVGLADKAQQYPAQLSGGQKQRVGIARALAAGPKVLLSDEATSALDPQTTKSILQLIADINKKLGLTVVIITHEMQVIKDICDKVAVIEGGVIAEKGSVLDIFTKPKERITREFVSTLLSNDLPINYRKKELLPEPVEGGELLLRLTFLGERADDPVIADVIRRFSIEVSILYGTLDQIKSVPYGRMIVGIKGEQAEIDRALAYLDTRDLTKEVIGYVR
ncbi:methionine ABC transporter ATP-binding protein [uncultured Selenomonas sp.]|uniref:methionine ABC transporter ATP-binding protein n=1 Tax=uncultured Selenomonas sp. TaxID=159275 RepID=UPI0028DB7706|nr:methionine ABC transporter ATP-binding protein [uncultured Selenomonas sp.]